MFLYQFQHINERDMFSIYFLWNTRYLSKIIFPNIKMREKKWLQKNYTCLMELSSFYKFDPSIFFFFFFGYYFDIQVLILAPHHHV